MQRRNFLKIAGMTTMSALASRSSLAQDSMAEKPNIIVFISDQHRFGLSKAHGYAADTSPTLDSLEKTGVSFEKNYCTAPLCVPSRISMLTGRWPVAHHVRMNLQAKDAFFSEDMYQVAKERGYRTGLAGKNHTYLKEGDLDYWRSYSHDSGPIDASSHPQSAEFEKWLKGLHYNVAKEPSPFPLETQLTYRITSDAIRFIEESGNQPFLLQVSVPEPHDPEQVPAPYWNMFPPESVPARCAGPEALAAMGPRAQWEYKLQQDNFPDTEKQWRRYVSNYLGALRMIDDQLKRLTEFLDQKQLTRKTLVVFTADHGDYLMDYGLGRKGVGLYEDLIHTPQVWWGYKVKHTSVGSSVFTSMADLMPTFCEAMGAEIPAGVQGRSLLPLLQGEDYPAQEFRSITSSAGVGGLYYEEEDHIPTTIASDKNHAGGWDELNKVTQSGNQKMVRMGDWKLVYDSLGYGALYNMKDDPCELHNLFGDAKHKDIQASLMAELAMWDIRLEDTLPTGPQNGKYQTKWPRRHNWYTPYRHGSTIPSAFIP